MLHDHILKNVDFIQAFVTLAVGPLLALSGHFSTPGAMFEETW